MPGIGGGGGGPPIGGIGGGGGAPTLGMGGGGGGEVGPPPIAGLVGVEPVPVPVADKGRGGPIVPKSMDARWRAFPAPGPSSSDESSSLSEPTTDHSSSSGRARERGPVGWEISGSAFIFSEEVGGRRWKGFVDTAVFAAGDETTGSADGGASFLKNGLFVSFSDCGLVTGRLVLIAGLGTGGTETGIGGGGGLTSLRSSSWLP
jgi:hypothetical protein